MRAGRYWAKAEIHAVEPSWNEDVHRTFLRGSFVSQEDAQRLVDEAAARARSDIESGVSDHSGYEYEESVRPEPVTDEMIDEGGDRFGVVTVNGYGASVINTLRVAFIDIDQAEYFNPSKPGPGLIGRLLGKKSNPPEPPSYVLDKALPALRECAAGGLGMRIYHTAGGVRVLLTTALMDPASEKTQTLFRGVQADYRYTLLCRLQECFRARVTPKPERMRCGWPPEKIRADQSPSPELASWEQSYGEECSRYAVCELLEQLGPPAEHPHIVEIQRIHDDLTGVGTGLPLA